MNRLHFNKALVFSCFILGTHYSLYSMDDPQLWTNDFEPLEKKVIQDEEPEKETPLKKKPAFFAQADSTEKTDDSSGKSNSTELSTSTEYSEEYEDASSDELSGDLQIPENSTDISTYKENIPNLLDTEYLQKLSAFTVASQDDTDDLIDNNSGNKTPELEKSHDSEEDRERTPEEPDVLSQATIDTLNTIQPMQKFIAPVTESILNAAIEELNEESAPSAYVPYIDRIQLKSQIHTILSKIATHESTLAKYKHDEKRYQLQTLRARLQKYANPNTSSSDKQDVTAQNNLAQIERLWKEIQEEVNQTSLKPVAHQRSQSSPISSQKITENLVSSSIIITPDSKDNQDEQNVEIKKESNLGDKLSTFVKKKVKEIPVPKFISKKQAPQFSAEQSVPKLTPAQEQPVIHLQMSVDTAENSKDSTSTLSDSAQDEEPENSSSEYHDAYSENSAQSDNGITTPEKINAPATELLFDSNSSSHSPKKSTSSSFSGSPSASSDEDPSYESYSSINSLEYDNAPSKSFSSNLGSPSPSFSDAASSEEEVSEDSSNILPVQDSIVTQLMSIIKNNNNPFFTLGALLMPLYSLHIKEKINNLPYGSELTRKKVSRSLRDALIANILINIPRYFQKNAIDHNGWIFISSYLATDLGICASEQQTQKFQPQLHQKYIKHLKEFGPKQKFSYKLAKLLAKAMIAQCLTNGIEKTAQYLIQK